MFYLPPSNVFITRCSESIHPCVNFYLTLWGMTGMIGNLKSKRLDQLENSVFCRLQRSPTVVQVSTVSSTTVSLAVKAP